MLPWFLFILFLLLSVTLGLLLVRATRRLLQFDELLQIIIDPMRDYQAELEKIATAEGLLTDHPEVIAFHRANMTMLAKIDAAITLLKEEGPPPQEPDVRALPPQVV